MSVAFWSRFASSAFSVGMKKVTQRKKLKTTNILLCICVFVLSGCVQQPVVPEHHLKPQDRVGYIIQPSGKVNHTHMGTTIFNNMEKKYNYDWKLEKDIQKSIEENIKYHMVNLSTYGIKYFDVKDMIVAKDGKWVIGKQNLYDKLLSKLHLSAVLVIGQDTTSIITGLSPIFVESSGLASIHFLGLKRYFAVSAYNFELYWLKPKSVVSMKDLTKSTIIYDSLLTSAQKNSGFNQPKDLEHIIKPLTKQSNFYLKKCYNTVWQKETQEN